MTRVSDLFEVRYGHSLELNRQSVVPRGDGIAFVSRTVSSNGVSAYVEPIEDLAPAPMGELSCALGANPLSTFLQPEPFYCGRDVACLIPKTEMTEQQKLFYCMCIQANAWRYSYGRQANRTLRDIVIPALSEIPSFVQSTEVPSYDGLRDAETAKTPSALETSKWKHFTFIKLFDVKKGKRLTKADMKPGTTPFISAIESNNGLRQYISAPPLHPGNVITVNYNGNGVAEAFYQTEPFRASDDVNILYPKFELNAQLALFLCTLIRAEKYRFSYGRKWALERMNKSTIRLPVLADGEPNWPLMESYIKSLPYSKSIQVEQ